MKTLKYFAIGILVILGFTQCDRPPFIYADPYNSVNFYFVNKTNEKCYVELTLDDYFCMEHSEWTYNNKDTSYWLQPQLVEPKSSKLILHDEGHVSADYNLPFRLGSLIVKNESGNIIYAQSPIKDELWNSKDKSEGLMWATDYYFNFTGQTGDTINSIYCKCNLSDTNKLKKHPVAYMVDNRFDKDSIIVSFQFNKKDNGHYNVESYPDTLISIIIPPSQYDIVLFRDTLPECSILERPSNFFNTLTIKKLNGDILFEQMNYNNCVWENYWYKGETRYRLHHIGLEYN